MKLRHTFLAAALFTSALTGTAAHAQALYNQNPSVQPGVGTVHQLGDPNSASAPVPAAASDAAISPSAGTVVSAGMPQPSGGQDAEQPRMVSGGIGDEMEYLRSVQNQYNLKLLFTETDGTFLSDVHVIVVDRQGMQAAETITKGPLLLIDLPPGTYKVEANSGEQTLSQKLTVPAHSLKSSQFRFQIPADEMAERREESDKN